MLLKKAMKTIAFFYICKNSNRTVSFLIQKLLSYTDEKKCTVFAKGEFICKQNQTFNHFCLLTSGLVKLYLEHRGKTIIIQLLTPGDIILFPALTEKNISTYNVVALQPSEVIVIGTNQFYRSIENDPYLSIKLLEIQNQLKNSFYHRIFSLTQKRAHGRVADALLYLSDDVFKNQTFLLPFPRKDFGAFTALSTESTIRILREMHNDKIIELSNRTVTLSSRSILEKLTQNCH
ncbi:MAG TPA: Crp/Fnr family transcriptional regulator [Salinivirgaceae bacterium]|nr:Crp/Fnr family transcriptional regulator [Salinivirgaceae bacterium]